MIYYIDGYNLLYSFFKEVLRENLIFYLDERLEIFKFRSILVFDNRVQSGSCSYLKNLQVVFTQGQSADEYIIECCRYKKNKVVVTCDKGLGRACRDLGAKIILCGDFLKYLKNGKAEEEKMAEDSQKNRERLEKIFEKRYKNLTRKNL